MCPHKGPDGLVCGQVHEFCLAHSKKVFGGRYTDGIKPCRLKPVPGLEVCKKHGGSARQSIRKSARYLARQEAADYLKNMEVQDAPENPIDHMGRLAAEAESLYEFFRDRVGQMKAEEHRYENSQGYEQQRAEILYMERALDRALKAMRDYSNVKIGDPAARKAGETLLDIVKNLGKES